LFDNTGKSISETFSASLQVNYDLFTAGRRPAQIRQAEEQIRLQELEVERTAEQLRLDVTTGYYALQQADAQVDISQAAVTEAAQSLRDAQLLEQAGLGTRFDVLQAQVRLAEANQDLIRAQSQQRIARRQLVQLLNLSQGVDVTAADPIEVAGDWTLSLEQTIVLALKNRAELEQELVQRDIGEQQRRIALSAIRPQASLSASYNILGVLNNSQSPSPTSDFRLGAALRWNFFEGGAARARARQASRNIEIAETRFANQRDQIRFQVEQAFSELNANAQNIQTATFALAQAEESLRLARLRFQAGVGTQTDVINQQTALTRARVNRLTAILDYNRALAQLQRATSNLPDSNLENLP
jgi:outer membrane protein TolC